MSLSVESRHCGAVVVVRCAGRIVTGEEVTVLQKAIDRGLREFPCIVLDTAEVTRVDSTGMGLLVRFLSHTRSRGGDLRLAAVPPFLQNLLQITKLSTIFLVYASEEEAIVSFLKDKATPKKEKVATGPTVLFVDQSADVCAFVRGLLHNHGYEVITTCRVQDARLLLMAGKLDIIVLGPDCSNLSSDNVVASFKTLAPSARTIVLHSDFKYEEAERASRDLLQKMESARPAEAT
ncbi:MAG: STAS domain-containing protein [Acidobacteriota bacterium]|nr:STAS domain-containing protein [Acidobacteriota bacterium]